ncbi:MAG TPA: HU family DNA-binding protein [Anaerolineales bacterium]|nr:HU family DNA-binding protein [Anaerolineales bacterium]
MSVKFNVVERGNPSNPEAPKKFYPSIQSSGRLTTREMAEIAARESTMSPADMMGAIEIYLSVIPRELAKGNIVEMGDFGSFWLRIEAEGVESESEVRAEKIKAVKPRFNPGKLFKKALSTIDFVKGAQTSGTPEED